MERYFLGVDGGGTKSTAVLLDDAGQQVARLTSGPMNCNSEAAQTVQATLLDLLTQVRQSIHTEPAAICIGAAGVSNPVAEQLLQQGLQQSGYSGPVRIVGDHQAALAGGTGRLCGIVLISGTGSICYGVNEKGEQWRTGGFGHIIDDQGSGYAIGRDILRAVVCAHDGRQSATLLSELVLAQLRLTEIAQLIRYVYAPERTKKELAALAPLLSKAVEAGDAVALELMQQTAVQLAALVSPVAQRLSLAKGELVLSGSILLRDQQLKQAFVKQLGEVLPGMTAITPRFDAATGAALLAREEKTDG